MKKSLLLVCSIALCLFVGCTEDEVVNGNSSLKGSIKAAIEESVSPSRLAVNSDNSLSWMQGDAFEMFTSEGTSETWTLTNVTNGLGLFTGSVPEGTLKYAFYPSSAENKPVLSGTELTMTIPHELTYSENATCDLPMYATLKSDNSLEEQTLSFKYLTAMLKINVNEIPDGFHTLTVKANQAIAGNFVVNLSNGGFYVQDQEADQKKEVKVSFNAISDSNNDRAFYLPLVAGNYQSLKVSISNGTKEIVLKEWTNRSIQARMVYWASLTIKESDTTVPAGVTSELESLTVENPTMTLTLTEPIVASETPIKVPVVEGVKAAATLEFAQTPTTSESIPLIIAEAQTTSQPDAEATNEMVLSFPNDESNPVFLNLETPKNTITVESGNFATIVAATAAHTFVVSDGVTIENLIVKAGNVVIQEGGEIGRISRHQDNADAQTFVILEEGADAPVLSEGVVLAGGALLPDYNWYYNDNVTTFEISTPAQLYGFMKLIENGELFVGKTVKLASDIDMFGYSLTTGGALISGRDQGFKGVFDGQGYRVKNLNMTYVPFEYNTISSTYDVFVGLIPVVNKGVVKNLTVEGGKIHIPSVMPDQDMFFCSPLVGYAREATVINCHNVNCDIVLENNGYVGGVVGRIAYVMDYETYNYLGSYLIACSNSGSIKTTVTSASGTSYVGGVTAGRWGSNSYIVGCYNTGSVTGACPEFGYAGGISAECGGYNQLYGCFNDAYVMNSVQNSGGLIGDASYSGYYNYSCYTGEKFVGYDLSGNYTEIKKVSSYAEAVETLNEGIAVYNALETTTVPCEYRYVAGSMPQLQKQ